MAESTYDDPVLDRLYEQAASEGAPFNFVSKVVMLIDRAGLEIVLRSQASAERASK